MVTPLEQGVIVRAAASVGLRSLSVECGVPPVLLAREALHLAQDPQVYARYPRECRVILDRRDQLRAARSAVRLRGH